MANREPPADRGSRAVAALFVNVHSRRGARLYPRVLEALRSEGIAMGMAAPVRRPSDIPRRVGEAVALGYDPIIVGGGDGTISSAVAALAGTGVRLGIVPLGTSNTFARTLGIPFSPRRAAAIVAAGHTADVDLAMANGRHFANSLTIGFSVDAVYQVDPTIKHYLGLVAYVLAAFRAFIVDRSFQVHLEADGGVLDVRSHQVAVANGTYFTRVLRAGPTASLESHRLVVFTLQAMNRVEFLGRILRLLLDRHAFDPRAHFFQTEALTISTSPRKRVNVDGEVIGWTPVDVRVVPAALRVLVPLEFLGQPPRVSEGGRHGSPSVSPPATLFPPGDSI